MRKNNSSKLKKIILPFIYSLCLLTIASLSQAAQPLYITVTKNHVNIRLKANNSAVIGTTANRGDEFKLLQESPEWFEVELPNGKHGFVRRTLAEVKAPVIKSDSIVVENATEVREQASPNADTIATANEGDVFKIINEQSGWYQIDLSLGKTGYVQKRYTKLQAPAQPVAESKKEPAVKKETAKPTGEYVIIISSGSFIRTAPTVKSKVVAQAKVGNAFKLVTLFKDFYAIKLPSGQKCYIPRDISKLITKEELDAFRTKREVAPVPEPVINEPAPPPAEPVKTEIVNPEPPKPEQFTKIENSYVQITKKNINLRQAPQAKSAVVSQAKNGEIFKLSGQTRDWYQVETSSGTAYFAARLGQVISEKAYLAMQEEEHQKKLAESQRMAEANERKLRAAEERKIKQEAELKEKEETARLAKEIQAREDEWLKDKYIKITNAHTNLRVEPNKNARVLLVAKPGETYKLLSRGSQWYEIFLPPDRNAFVSVKLAKVIAEAEVLSAPPAPEPEAKPETKPEPKPEPPPELKPAEPPLNAPPVPNMPAQPTASSKVKPKYVLIMGANAELKAKASPTAALRGLAKQGDYFKLVWRLKDYFEVETSSGTAFIDVNAGQVIREEEIPLNYDGEQEANFNKIKREAELSQKREEARLAKLTAEQKIKEEQLQQEKAAAANEQEWLKDKYVQVNTKNTNVRAKPNKNAQVIIKAAAGDCFKLTARAKDWYEVNTSTGTAYIFSTLARVITEIDLQKIKDVENQAREDKTRLEAEAQARKAAERQARQEAEQQAKLKREAEQKARLAAQQQANEEQARKLAEAQAQEEAWLKDKYALITGNNIILRKGPDRTSAIAGRAKDGDALKMTGRTKYWYKVFLPPEFDVYVSTLNAAVITEQELTAKLDAEKKDREEAEQKKRDAAEFKAKQEAERQAKLASYIRDKYIIIAANTAALRQKPFKNSAVIGHANNDQDFKLLGLEEDKQNNQWYQVNFTSGTQIINAYLFAGTARVVTAQELADVRKAQEQARQDKLRLEAEMKARRAYEQRMKLAAEQQAKEAAERQAKEKAEFKARQESEAKAKRDAEQKAKLEAEQKAREQKDKIDQEAKVRELEWLKDKYVLIINKDTNLRTAATKNANIVAKAQPQQSYKLVSRTKNQEWYLVDISSGTAFVNAGVVKLYAEAELKAKLETEQKAQEEAAAKAKSAAELKAQQEAEAKAKHDAEIKAKQEAEQKAAVEKARLKAEAETAEKEWLKDKFVLTTIKEANLRSAPSKTADIISKIPADQSFKLVSRDKDWYQITTSSGTAYISTTVSKVLTEQELAAYRQQMEQAKAQREAELKAKLEAEQRAAEEKARIEAEAKAKREAELKAKLEAEQKAKAEAAERARLAAEEKARLEAEAKAKKEAELKAKFEAEQKAAVEKARLESEAKAKETDWLKDKYVLVTVDNSNLRSAASKNDEIIGKTKIDASFKMLSRRADWYEVGLTSGTAYISATITKVMTDQELATYRQQQEQARQEKIRNEAEAKAARETELKAKLAAEQKTKAEAAESARLAAEEKARLEAEAKAKHEAEVKARLEAEQKARAEAEAKAKAAAELKAQQQAEDKARQEAELKARLAAEQLAREEAERKAQEAAALRAQAEAEAKAKKEAELKARQEEAERLKEEKARREEEAKARMEALVRDKHIIITNEFANLRQQPSKNAPIISRVNKDQDLKLTWIQNDKQNNQWYQVEAASGTASVKVYVMSSLARIVSDQELQDYRLSQEKDRQEAELKAKLETEAKARRAAEEKARLEAERVAKLQAEFKASQDAEIKAREAAELKAKQDAEERARLEAELKAKQEAEQKAAAEEARLKEEQRAKEEYWLSDKYVLVLNDTALRSAPKYSSGTIVKAPAAESYKLLSRDNKDFYQVATASGTAYLAVNAARVLNEQELNELRAAQAKAREEAEVKARLAAEEKAHIDAAEKARRESEMKALLAAEQKSREEKSRRLAAEQAARETDLKNQLVVEQKAREDAEQKAREASTLREKLETEQKDREAAEIQARLDAEHKAREEKARREAESRAQMENFVKDKYIIITGETADLKKAPSTAAATIAKAQNDEAYKLTWVQTDQQNHEWYKISITQDKQPTDAYILSTATKLMSSQELEEHRLAQEKAVQEAELKAKLEAEAKAKREAEEKARIDAERIVKLQAELKAKEEAIAKAKAEAEAKAILAAQEKARLAAEKQAREEAERKAKEEKARLEAEAKAKMEAYVQDKYILITRDNTRILGAAIENGQVLSNARTDDSFKLTWINNNWYEISLASGTASIKAFVPTMYAKILTDKELAAKRDADEKARVEKIRQEQEQAKLEAEAKAKREAEEKARLEAERIAREEKARREAEAKARREAELKAQLEAGQKARAEAEAKAQAASELRARLEQQAQAAKEAELKAKAEAEQRASTEKSLLEATAQAQAEKTAAPAPAAAPETEKAQEAILAKASQEELTEDKTEYAYVSIKAAYAEIRTVPDLTAPALFVGLKGDVFKYNGQEKGWYHILTFSGETRYIRKSLCQGTNIAPVPPKKESDRKEIYDGIVDAKDRAMTDTNIKYPAITTQQELQEKVYFQQTTEEKFLLEVFHKYKIPPAIYLSILTEAIDKSW